MKVKEVKRVLSDTTTMRLHIARSREDARNEKSIEQKCFTCYRSMSDYYGELTVEYIYPAGKDNLDVWAIKEG